MMSEKKSMANRLNAKKSTGPKTARGKQHARLNALSYGIYAKALLLPEEDRDSFAAIEKDLFEDVRPVGPIEVICADRALSAIVRLCRLKRAEQIQMEHSINGIARKRFNRYAEHLSNKYPNGIPTDERSTIFSIHTKLGKPCIEDLEQILSASVANLTQLKISTLIDRKRRLLFRELREAIIDLEWYQTRRRAGTSKHAECEFGPKKTSFDLQRSQTKEEPKPDNSLSIVISECLPRSDAASESTVVPFTQADRPLHEPSPPRK